MRTILLMLAALPLSLSAATALPTQCPATYDCTVRAGVATVLDASGNAASSYAWTQLAYPTGSPADFGAGRTDSTSAAPSITFPKFGTYTLKLATIISGSPSSLTFKVGAVSTNNDGVVILPRDALGSKIEFLLGPMFRNGLTGWTKYDEQRAVRGRYWGDTYAGIIASSFDTPAAGTISLTNGSGTVTGSGTAFQTLFACNGTDAILLYHPVGGGVFGRAPYTVSTCPSQTSMTITPVYAQTTGSGVQYQKQDPATDWGEGVNYYDSVLVQYQNYYRTGIDDYLVYARRLARAWFRFWQFDEGRHEVGNFTAPRNQSAKGLMLWALDTADSGAKAADVWTWLEAQTNYHLDLWVESKGIGDGQTYPAADIGVRESGYMLMYAADLARVDPNSGVQAAYASRVAATLTDYFAPLQCQSGNPGTRCQSPAGAYKWEAAGYWIGKAEQPFHVGVAMEGVYDAYRLATFLGDTSTANGWKAVLQAWVDHMVTGNTGSPGNLPLISTIVCSDFDAAVTARSVYYLAYANPGGPLVVSANGTVGGGYIGAEAVLGNCTSAYQLLIDRTVNNEAIAPFGYAYSLLGTASYKTAGDNLFSSTFGYGIGPGADAYGGQLMDTYKQHGQGSRSTGTYLANRTGSSVAEISQTLSVGFNLASIVNATKVVVALTKPSGEVVTTSPCTTSPCTVSADLLQGAHSYRLQYLSAGDAVLASSSAGQLARVQ